MLCIPKQVEAGTNHPIIQSSNHPITQSPNLSINLPIGWQVNQLLIINH